MDHARTILLELVKGPATVCSLVDLTSLAEPHVVTAIRSLREMELVEVRPLESGLARNTYRLTDKARQLHADHVASKQP